MNEELTGTINYKGYSISFMVTGELAYITEGNLLLIAEEEFSRNLGMLLSKIKETGSK